MADKDRAMLEASMILHRDSANMLLGLALTGSLENLVVSETFIRLAAGPDLAISRFAHYLEIPVALVDQETTQRLARTLQEIGLVSYGEGLELESSTYERLKSQVRDEFVAKVLFEEYTFLTSQSWLFCKMRTALDAMVEAGATAVHKSRSEFERITRKMLGKKEGESLSPNDKAKAAAKWIAVAGIPFLAVAAPWIGAGVGIAGNVFMLSDP